MADAKIIRSSSSLPSSSSSRASSRSSLRIFSMNNCVGEKIKTNQVLFWGYFIASFVRPCFRLISSFLSFRYFGENCSVQFGLIFFGTGLPRMVASLGIGWWWRTSSGTPSRSSEAVLMSTVLTIFRPSTQSRNPRPSPESY